jgi:hypothetical protein
MSDIPVLNIRRIRRIKGGFSFIPHRFLNDRFFASLNHTELLLYFFLVLVSDRFGMSFYGDESIMRQVGLGVDELHQSRELLIEKDLIVFEPPFVQVLDLPNRPVFHGSGAVENPASKILRSLQGETDD